MTEIRRIPGPHGPLRGSMALPASKSLSNRALIAAAAAGGGRISGILDCRDTRVLAGALESAGFPVRWRDGDVLIGKRIRPAGCPRLDLEDSGTGARLLTALAAALKGEYVIDGSARLRQRPMKPLLDALRMLGAEIESTAGGLPLSIRGGCLRGGRLSIDPESSSQFVSALLMIAPLLDGGLQLEVHGEIPSAPYLLLTRQVMRSFGVDVQHDEELRHWNIPPGVYGKRNFAVEADWSAAAFPVAAVGLVGGEIFLESLDPASVQGDRRMLDILGAAGLEVFPEKGGIRLRGKLRSEIRADLLSCPDLFPALSVLVASPGIGGELRGLQHLRHKESDRLQAMKSNLEALGAVFDISEKSLRVRCSFEVLETQSRRVDAWNDHRIAMAAALTALKAGPLEIDHPECVGKSFPAFWEEWKKLLALGPGS